jgi:hypothetical protein
MGRGVAGWVEEAFRAYLRCGILARGFARIRCDDCASSLSSPTPSPRAPSSAASTSLTPRPDFPPPDLPPQAALELEPDPVAPVDPLPADDFDQRPAFDPAEPVPVPELDLDQTRGA